jgi:hypothetical protein
MKVSTSSLMVALFLFVVLVAAEPADDLVKSVPGYTTDFKNRVFAGYLNTESSKRSLHYIFM